MLKYPTPYSVSLSVPDKGKNYSEIKIQRLYNACFETSLAIKEAGYLIGIIFGNIGRHCFCNGKDRTFYFFLKWFSCVFWNIALAYSISQSFDPIGFVQLKNKSKEGV